MLSRCRCGLDIEIRNISVLRPFGAMPHAKFTPAIWIRDNGAITVRSVETLAEVVAFLDHWPYARRDPAYQTAMDLAQKATVGYVTVDEARDAFWAFAAGARILAESNVA